MAADDFLGNPSIFGGCVYYAQNREDLIVQSFFPGIRKGFYVDVGAFDPNEDSVTKLFYLAGWHGINIEPQTERFRLFQQQRKRDINLNVGVAEKEGQLTLRTYKSEGLATFSDTVKHDYEQAPDMDTEQYVETTVPVYPLRKILADHKVNHIDFLKVDVEGLEYQVLASNDWKRFRPEVLCIEANHIKHDWRPLLKAADYERIFDDGLNVYYVDKHTDRKHSFNFVKDVISDRGGGLRADHYERMYRLYEFATQKANHVKVLERTLAKSEHALQDATAQVSAYEAELRSIRATSGHLMRLLKRNIKGS